jgi:hypothetical protein
MRLSKIPLAALCIGGLMIVIPRQEHPASLNRSAAMPGRKSITFIMGEDKTPQPYYALAADHFALDAEAKTNYVIRTCHTLEAVIQYLNSAAERDEMPWDVVNIVAHGNPQTGLNLYITENGYKATPKRLLQAALRGDTPVLESGVVDSMTQINFYSCGIGTSAMIQVSLRQIFKPAEGASAKIYCSSDFIVFHPSLTGAAPRMVRASYWPYYFRRGYRPSDSEIIHALRNEYPEEDIAWSAALDQNVPSDSIEEYHGEYHIPVSYTRIYETKEERPSVGTADEKMLWVRSQPEIREQLDQAGIPEDRYSWTVNRIIHTQPDGKQVPAIKAIGMATVLYVLKENPTSPSYP